MIGAEEVEESKIQGTESTFNKIIENFPNLKKEMTINIQKPYRIPIGMDQKRKYFCQIMIKTQNLQNKGRLLKVSREKGQVTYKGRPIRIIPDFSKKTLKTRRA